jgi:ferric-dicitrate binding protein FerR (iron transport regulator)
VAETEPKPDDDAAIARLLRASGKREQPAEDLERHIRAAVHAEWRATVAQRGRLRQRIWMAAAASILVLVAGLWVMQTRLSAPGTLVAKLDRLEGSVNVSEQSPLSWLTGNRWRVVQPREQMRARAALQTRHDGRAALTVGDSISLRLDHDTRIAFIDEGRIEVLHGAVYVDAGAAPAGRGRLLLDTPAGAVRHVGTQYEVRVLPAGTRIRVREGRVELSDAAGASEQLTAGEQLFVALDGAHSRASAAASGSEWSWIGEVAPPIDIEGRPLSDLLDWVARETGRRVVFVDAQTEAEAASAVLHGSVAGLSPDEALQAVLPTTRLRGTLRDGDMLIEMP